MATCPICHGEMDAFARACPHCGYDFPLNDPVIDQLPLQPEARGFAYSTFAEAVLLFGLGLAWLGVTLATVVFFTPLVRQEWGRSFGALFSIFGCLIQTIVLQRVIDLSKD